MQSNDGAAYTLRVGLEDDNDDLPTANDRTMAALPAAVLFVGARDTKVADDAAGRRKAARSMLYLEKDVGRALITIFRVKA